jgi:FkbM family methyltransferase
MGRLVSRFYWHSTMAEELSPQNKKIIYDFGSNNGDDIPYYLLKADIVVAVEANPILVAKIEERFSDEITEGRLFVENCVLTVDNQSESVPFFLHKKGDVLSTAADFAENDPSFEKIFVKPINVIELIYFYGEPYYIKIDLEGIDHIILECLFLNNIRPPYISAESHLIEVFCLMVAIGNYSSFKLVDGYSVSKRYNDCMISTSKGSLQYSFPFHSAGPFGNDIHGQWMTPANFFRVLSYAGLGWKDIHASRLDAPNSNYVPQPVVNITIDF